MSHNLYVPLTIVAILVLGVILLVARASRNLRETRERFIRGYAFPAIVRERILRLHPEWSRENLEEALAGLREFAAAAGAGAAGGSCSGGGAYFACSGSSGSGHHGHHGCSGGHGHGCSSGGCSGSCGGGGGCSSS